MQRGFVLAQDGGTRHVLARDDKHFAGSYHIFLSILLTAPSCSLETKSLVVGGVGHLQTVMSLAKAWSADGYL